MGRENRTSSVSVMAVTFATRGLEVASAISPKKSPSLSVVTSIFPFSGSLSHTLTLPSFIRYIVSPISPCLTMVAPLSYLLEVNLARIIFLSPVVTGSNTEDNAISLSTTLSL